MTDPTPNPEPPTTSEPPATEPSTTEPSTTEATPAVPAPSPTTPDPTDTAVAEPGDAGAAGAEADGGEDGVPEAGGDAPQVDAEVGAEVDAEVDAEVGAGGDEDYLPAGQTAMAVGDEVVVDDATMRRALEAILMVTDEPLPVLTLARAVGRPTGDVAAALEQLAAEYTEQDRGFDLREVGGGWRYYTRADAAQYVERFVLDGQQARLTQAALETLAVVAYKQPVSRARVSAIRGVNVDGVMRTLVARGLVEEAGSDTESQATLYRTTTYFLERMGMQSLDDLPELAPYLPEMDDIEEELAAQSLPPTPDPTTADSATGGSTDAGGQDSLLPDGELSASAAAAPTESAAAVGGEAEYAGAAETAPADAGDDSEYSEAGASGPETAGTADTAEAGAIDSAAVGGDAEGEFVDGDDERHDGFEAPESDTDAVVGSASESGGSAGAGVAGAEGGVRDDG